MGTISSTTRSIEDDYKDIQNLFAAAKTGKWEIVFNIIGTPDRPLKPYLINIIPENRRWGLLHQAVWWNNHSAITKLLQFAACDEDSRAKEGVCEKGDTGGFTAAQIAKAFGYLKALEILNNPVFKHNRNIGVIETFYIGPTTIINEEYGLFRLTLASYKETFHPSSIDKTKPMSELVNAIYRHVTTGSNWKIARDKITHSIYCHHSICQIPASHLKDCKTQEAFFTTLIKLYTNENTPLYTYANTALRRQRDIGYHPTSDEIALGPYIVMFQVVLSCWTILKRETMITYRKMKITSQDLNEYQPGKKFTWLSFVSSSINLASAEIFPSCEASGDIQVHFVIDNSKASRWQPLNIESYAYYREMERVYPASAQFLVTKHTVQHGVPTEYLQLLAGEV